ncbi:PepSY domain-containing protein [Agarivorans aestuarii]|uniref:PepSY domain-containing protein n=1 Tax=Agarivorans aestuarii TaxID=1563703 RepID=A0ABU7G6L4_9ALTE|nr:MULTISPECIES: PepSY domain-containing protein [Agarivorans]MEE1674948.1 PepSY domain-containing protein [Agarivorans aestuarii]
MKLPIKLSKKICVAAAVALTSTAVMADDDALSALAIKKAGFSLEQAIEKVHNTYPGQITELELDDYRGQAVYEVDVVNLAQEQKHKLKLSLADGEMLKNESSKLSILGVSKLDEDERIALEQLAESELSLQQTVAMLNNKYQAQVIEFELENEKGITFYKFKLLGEQGKQRVIVDVASGETIPVLKH